MLLPNKHIRTSESLLGLGSFLLELLSTPKTIDELWLELQKANEDNMFLAYHSLENLILTLGFLYSIGAIDEGYNGRIELCA